MLNTYILEFRVSQQEIKDYSDIKDAASIDKEPIYIIMG
tara:strand:- start:583 stop:699 length:117 start_codon:yes stop_codon:yes gene_type:complete